MPCRLIRIVVIVLLTIAGGIPLNAQDTKKDGPLEWKPFTSTDGHYRVSMPGSPKEAESAQWGSKVLATKVGASGNYFAVGHRDVEKEELKKTADQLLEEHMKALVKHQEGIKNGRLTVLKKEKIKLGDIPGREIQIEIRGVPFTDSQMVRSRRVYLSSGRMYLVEAFGIDDFATSKDARRFFDSFKLEQIKR